MPEAIHGKFSERALEENSKGMFDGIPREIIKIFERIPRRFRKRMIKEPRSSRMVSNFKLTLLRPFFTSFKLLLLYVQFLFIYTVFMHALRFELRGCLCL